MKILFVDEHSSLQEKWIEPLRGEGWGVIRTRSASDAEQVFQFHGDSIDVMIVSEVNASWADRWNIPYLLLKTTWKDVQVMKHQNSSEQPAFAYLDFDSNFELLKQAVEDAKSKGVVKNLKKTGTDVSLSPVASPDYQDADHSGIVIQLEKYGSENKPEIESHHPAAKPGIAIAADEEDQSDRTKLLDVSLLNEAQNQEKSSVNLQSFMNEDFNDPVVQDSVPHELLSAAVEQMGGEALPKREATKIGIQSMDEDDTVMVNDVDMKDEVNTIDLSADQDLSVLDEEPLETLEEAPVVDYLQSESVRLQNSDVETMKNYLALREQDVMVLTGQMRSAQERVRQLEALLKVERARNAELVQNSQKQDQQIKSFERDKQVEHEVLFNQIEDLNTQIRDKTDKVRAFETKLRIATDEVEKVKGRVRIDLRRIRVREKELENQLEILKKDSSALLVARDEKILELKRKIDLLEFNMELVQEQFNKERNTSEQLRLKLKEAAGVMKRAGGLLDQEN